MQGVRIQAWKPRKSRRRGFPIVAVSNTLAVIACVASTIYFGNRIMHQAERVAIVQQPAQQPEPSPVIPARVERTAPAVTRPVAKAERPEPEPPPIELVDISQPREPLPLEVKSEPLAIVRVDVSNGRQIVELPTSGDQLKIESIDGLPGFLLPSHNDLSRELSIDLSIDRAVYLLITTNGDRMKIEPKSTIPQYRQLSVESVTKVRAEATKRHAAALQAKAAIMTQIGEIESYLKDGTAKKLTVYNQGRSRIAVLQTQLEVAEVTINQAKSDLETSERVYRTVTHTLPKLRLILQKN